MCAHESSGGEDARVKKQRLARVANPHRRACHRGDILLTMMDTHLPDEALYWLMCSAPAATTTGPDPARVTDPYTHTPRTGPSSPSSPYFAALVSLLAPACFDSATPMFVFEQTRLLLSKIVGKQDVAECVYGVHAHSRCARRSGGCNSHCGTVTVQSCTW